MAASAEDAHAVKLAATDEPKAIVLYFERPVRAGWDPLAGDRDARLNKACRAMNRNARQRISAVIAAGSN
jgi:hypothetical protein